MYDIKETPLEIKKIILIASDSDFFSLIEKMKQKVLKPLFILSLIEQENQDF